jgi:tetratricopeptide (TPR) repeat protein
VPPPSSADPRIDLTESDAIKVNKPASLALVRSAVRKASVQGKTPIYALARRDECLALLYSDQPEGVLPACEDAYNVFLSAGNRAGAADAVRLIGDRQGSEGHYAEAIATYERALSLLDGLGEYGRTGAILNNMAINFANQGKLDLAHKYYEEAKADFEEVGEKINSATANTNIADILYLRGNLPAAEKGYRRSLELLATADHAENGYELYRLADLELTRGNIKDAKANAQEAVDAYRSSQGSFQYLTGAMVVLGKIMEMEGDFTGARAQFAQTLAIRQRMGESDLAAESRVELANLSIEDGHPEQAIQLLQNAITVFEKEKADPDASDAYTKLSRAQLLMGKLDEARNSFDQALKLSATNSDPALRLATFIQKAQIDSASASGGAAISAQQKLRGVSAEARKRGYFILECEARFTLAKMQMRTNASSANSQLSTLAAEARSHGFLLVARRAEQVLAGSSNVLADNKVLR